LEKGETNSGHFHSRLRWRRIKNELTDLDVEGV